MQFIENRGRFSVFTALVGMMLMSIVSFCVVRALLRDPLQLSESERSVLLEQGYGSVLEDPEPLLYDITVIFVTSAHCEEGQLCELAKTCSGQFARLRDENPEAKFDHDFFVTCRAQFLKDKAQALRRSAQQQP